MVVLGCFGLVCFYVVGRGMMVVGCVILVCWVW